MPAETVIAGMQPKCLSSGMHTQNSELVEMKQFMTPAHALKIATHDNAQLFALSGKRNPYPGKLGVVQPGA